MTTLSTLPVYPAPGRQTSVTFTLTESGANFVRVWCTAAPPGSEMRKRIDGTKDPRNRVVVHSGAGGVNNPWREDKFDKGGKYTFVTQEYTRGASAFGGGYQGDPEGAPSETKAGAETELELFIGQRMTSEISVGGDSLTVVLWVWDGNIRETTVATHGEVSPALQATSPTVKAQAAMETTTVQAALAALVGDSVATAVGNPSEVLGLGNGEFIKEWNDHMVNNIAHEDFDPGNDIPTGLASAPSGSNLQDTVNECLRKMRQHYMNDAIDDDALDPRLAGRDTGNYHNVSDKVNDNTNMPIVKGVSSAADAYWAVADIWRSYEAHRVSTAVHDAADSVNDLDDLPTLLALGAAIFTVWASTSPTTPATQSDGAMTLIARAGFSETPLGT